MEKAWRWSKAHTERKYREGGPHCPGWGFGQGFLEEAVLRLKLKGRSCELGEEWANCSRRSRGRKGKTEGLGLWSSFPCDPED